MKRVIVSLAVLGRAACATPHEKRGPRVRGVAANAPRDTIGVMLS
jgi:hypothetical protein